MGENAMKMAKKYCLCAAAAAAALAWSSVAVAQEADDTAAETSQGLQDIVVTANKRSENLQRAPAAVSVVGEDLLANAGIVDITQLNKLVPSLVLGKQGSNAVLFLRGVGQTSSTPAAQPAISQNIDGVYVPRDLGGTVMFDLERVEVLPGPQGTLYGRSAAGGVINLVTRKPGKDFAVEGSINVGNYALVHGFTGVDVPLTDGLYFRGALDINKRDGYVSNGTMDEDSLAGRASLLFEPSDRVSALLQYTYIRAGGLGVNLKAKGGANPPFGSTTDPWFNSFPTDDTSFHQRGHIITGSLDVDLNDDVTLSYIGNYSKSTTLQKQQFFLTLFAEFPLKVWQVSQELRLTNNGSGRLKWLGGLYWYKSHSNMGPTLSVPGGGPKIASVLFDNKLDSWAAFGEATYSVSDDFRVTVGGRYSSDKFDGSGYQINFLPPPGSSEFYDASERKGRVDWKVGVQYDAAAQSMLYLTAQSGYLQGGFTQVDKGSNFDKTFKPVEMIALTGGSKNRFFGNSLQINAEIFYYSYKNYQTQTVALDPVTNVTKFIIRNMPVTEIYGNQLDIVYSPTRNTDLSLSVAYLHSEVTKGIAPPSTPPPVGYKSFLGYEMPNAPKWTINGSIEHRFPLANGGNITARIASSYSSGYWLSFNQEAFTRQGSFTKTDANLTYNAPDGRWYLGAWARNLENSAVYYGAQSPSFDGASVPAAIDAPRTYGIRAGFNF